MGRIDMRKKKKETKQQKEKEMDETQKAVRKSKYARRGGRWGAQNHAGSHLPSPRLRFIRKSPIIRRKWPLHLFHPGFHSCNAQNQNQASQVKSNQIKSSKPFVLVP
jgi:hypothetical protein